MQSTSPPTQSARPALQTPGKPVLQSTFTSRGLSSMLPSQSLSMPSQLSSAPRKTSARSSSQSGPSQPGPMPKLSPSPSMQRSFGRQMNAASVLEFATKTQSHSFGGQSSTSMQNPEQNPSSSPAVIRRHTRPSHCSFSVQGSLKGSRSPSMSVRSPPRSSTPSRSPEPSTSSASPASSEPEAPPSSAPGRSRPPPSSTVPSSPPVQAPNVRKSAARTRAGRCVVGPRNMTNPERGLERRGTLITVRIQAGGVELSKT